MPRAKQKVLTDRGKKDELELATEIMRCADDPERYVRFAFPWGQEGTILEKYDGPDDWQVDILQTVKNELKKHGKLGDITFAIQIAVASGHGIGKSCLVAWIILWFLSTHMHPAATITANTKGQLTTKTWRELAKWWKLSINKHWFDWTATKFYAVTEPETWMANAIPWSKENSEAFAGMHEEWVLIIFDESCHDEKTEILTKSGWKYFKDITYEDEVITMNQKTLIAEYNKIKKIHKYDHDGDMYVYNNRGADFKITANHKMFVRGYDGRKKYFDHGNGERKIAFRFEKIKNAPGNTSWYCYRNINWEANDIEYFTIPSFKSKRKYFKETKVDFNLWIEFLGWYISEGSLIKHVQVDGVVAYNGIAITQKSEKVLNEIAELCTKIGFKPKIYKNVSTPQIHILNRSLAEYLSLLGVNCTEKTIPNDVRFASKKQINIFLNAYLRGDGYKNGNRNIYYTSSKSIADTLQELVFKSGAQSTITTRKLKGQCRFIKDHYGESRHDGYVISQTFSNQDAYIRTKNIKKEYYKGITYCVELEKNHLLFTRRNGRCIWSGNSAIDDIIWEVASGAETTGKVLWFAFGNPTRNSGKFKECFGHNKHRWITRQIDSRTAKMSNKELLQHWIDDYGEDSDYVRVRVLGKFPRVSSMQFIPTDVAETAARREYGDGEFLDYPTILSTDVARFGDDQSVIYVRRGFKSLYMQAFRGIDTMQFASKTAEVAKEFRAQVLFIDVVGVGAGVADRLTNLNYDVIEVNAGMSPADPDKYVNKRIEMWDNMKTWLKNGGQIPNDQELIDDLTGIEYGYNGKEKMELEHKKDMKARGLASPDKADVIAHSFFMPVRLINEDENYGRDSRQAYEDRLKNNGAGGY